AEPVDHVVEAALQLAEQRLAHDALLLGSPAEGQGELPLHHAVEPLRLLLLLELEAVALQLALDPSSLAVLAGGVVALLDRALLGEAAVPLQEQLHPLPTAQTADRTDVSGHFDSLNPAPLGRATAVVGDGGDVLDGLDLHPRGLEGADRRLPSAS